jgi:hypothetical protein
MSTPWQTIRDAPRYPARINAIVAEYLGHQFPGFPYMSGSQ